jgi:hypothetical protein
VYRSHPDRAPIEDDDFGGGGARSGEEVIQPLRRTEQMTGGAGIDQ